MQQVILKQDNLRKYASIFNGKYDELFEVDLKVGVLRAVILSSSNDDKSFKVKSGQETIEGIAESLIYKEDQATFLSAFSVELKDGLMGNHETRSVEFRVQRTDGCYTWVRGTLFCCNTDDQDVLLFGTKDIEAERKTKWLEERNEHLTNLIMDTYLGILELDLHSEDVTVLKHLSNQEMFFNSGNWDAWVEKFCMNSLFPHDQVPFLEKFSMEKLKEFFIDGVKGISVEVRYTLDGYNYEWSEISILDMYRGGKQSQKIYIAMRDISEKKLLKSLVELYIYNTCDYCIHLDAKNNSYLMFSCHDDGTPIPPSKSDDYAAALIQYAKDFVAQKDQLKVAKETQMERVLEKLESCGDHTFTYGVEDPVRGYTRKQLKYTYYDRLQQKILLTCRDVTNIYLEEKRRREQMRNAMRKAETDELTGLYNRAVKQMILQRVKEDDLAAVMFIDIDNFKSVNDTYGHAVGDEMLQAVASILQASIRVTDLSGRIGGDEFVVYLSQIETDALAVQCARRLRNSIKVHFSEKFPDLDVSCSIGVALYPQDSKDGEGLFEKADQMAYQAKWNGKNRVIMYSDYMKSQTDKKESAKQTLAPLCVTLVT